jgi:hypothetical protein
MSSRALLAPIGAPETILIWIEKALGDQPAPGDPVGDTLALADGRKHAHHPAEEHPLSAVRVTAQNADLG